jgi:cobalt/nickel transport system permease protein
MGIAAPLAGYAVYRGVAGIFHGRQGMFVAIGFASWCSIVVAALLCAGELVVSGTVPWNAAFPAMTNVHMIIGLGESVITVLILAAVAAVRPELLAVDQTSRVVPVRAIVMYGLILSLALALFASPLASSWPDGLAHVISALGLEHKTAAVSMRSAPILEYRFPGISSPVAATALAAVVGTVLAFALAVILSLIVTPKTRTKA